MGLQARVPSEAAVTLPSVGRAPPASPGDPSPEPLRTTGWRVVGPDLLGFRGRSARVSNLEWSSKGRIERVSPHDCRESEVDA
eukprot:1179334-Prorocentrum_minimum.AAC.3